MPSVYTDAVRDYLDFQDEMRSTLGRAVRRVLKRWHPAEKSPRGDDVWRTVHVEEVGFAVDRPLQDAAAAGPAFAPPNLHLTVYLHGPWSDEHQCLAWFENGILLSCGIEG